MMTEDKTSRIEAEVVKENQPKLKYLLRLWGFVFTSATAISATYLGFYIALSLLRPFLATIWSRYIDLAAMHLPGGEILPLLALLLAYYGLNFLIDLINRYVAGSEDIERLDQVQANRFLELVNTRIYSKLSEIDPEYWEVPKINDTIDRTLKFTSQPRDGLSAGVMRQSYVVVAKLVSVLSIAASLYVFSPWLCLIILCAPVPSLYTLLIGRKLRFVFLKENSHLERRAEYFQSLMLKSGAKEIRAMGLFDFFYIKWKSLMDEFTLKEQKLYRTETLLRMINTLVSSSAGVAANLLAIVLLSMGRISIGALGAVFSLVSTLLDDTGELINGIAELISKKHEAALFYDLMDLQSKVGSGDDLATFSELSVDHLSYRYPLTSRYVIDDVSLRIQKGEKVALVGENGAGKTTFVKLVAALISPSLGEVRINGTNAADLDLESRFNRLSTVTQNPARYATFSVAENVYLGDTLAEPEEARIDEALAFAGLTAIDKGAILGKETGGTDLSGGEWQKLAIARACYRNRDMIILDEPTSNLDPLSESEVFRKYIDLARDRTVLFVTHRISVAALAERIVVFADGKIIEDGSHEKLLALNGRYAQLYREQAKWYDR